MFLTILVLLSQIVLVGSILLGRYRSGILDLWTINWGSATALIWFLIWLGTGPLLPKHWDAGKFKK